MAYWHPLASRIFWSWYHWIPCAREAFESGALLLLRQKDQKAWSSATWKYVSRHTFQWFERIASCSCRINLFILQHTYIMVGLTSLSCSPLLALHHNSSQAINFNTYLQKIKSKAITPTMDKKAKKNQNNSVRRCLKDLFETTKTTHLNGRE